MKVILFFSSLLIAQYAHCQILNHFNGTFGSSFGLGIKIECDTFSKKINGASYYETRWIHTDGLTVTQNVGIIDSVIYFMYSLSDSIYALPCYSLRRNIKQNDTFYINQNNKLIRLQLGKTLDSKVLGGTVYQNVYTLKSTNESGQIIEIYINRKYGWLAIFQNKEMLYWRKTADR